MLRGRFDDEEDPIQVEIVIMHAAISDDFKLSPINVFLRRWLPHRTGTIETPKTSSKSSSTRARSSESATEHLIFIKAFLCKIIYRIINVNAIQNFVKFVVKFIFGDFGVGDFYLNLRGARPASFYYHNARK
jgi:hypothetical protein